MQANRNASAFTAPSEVFGRSRGRGVVDMGGEEWGRGVVDMGAEEWLIWGERSG